MFAFFQGDANAACCFPIRFEERSHIACFKYKRLESDVFLQLLAGKSSHWKTPVRIFCVKFVWGCCWLPLLITHHSVWAVCFFISVLALLSQRPVKLALFSYRSFVFVLLISCTLSVRYKNLTLGLFLARALQPWCCQSPLHHIRKYWEAASFLAVSLWWSQH